MTRHLSHPGEAAERSAQARAARALRGTAAAHTRSPRSRQYLPPDTPLEVAGQAEHGHPLSAARAAHFGSLLGADLGHVRIHDDHAAATLAEAASAQAFTVGSHVFFNRGEYRPDTGAGRALLAHELAHVIEAPPGPARLLRQPKQAQGVESEQDAEPARPGSAGTTDPRLVLQYDKSRRVDPRLTNDPVGTAISQARVAYPQYEATLVQVRLRAITRRDKTDVSVENRGNFSYPSQILRADEGFYLFEWDASGDFGRSVINLETGSAPPTTPDVRALAGEKEIADLRKQRIGVVWITLSVTTPPKSRDKLPDELELSLNPSLEVSPDDYRRMIDKVGLIKLTIVGLTGGVFEPGHEYGRPLNFRYESQDGMSALVTRKLIGREFHYLIPISVLQDYLRAYPFEYAGVSAGAWVPIYKLLFEVGVTFVPVIGPLIMLYEAGQAAVHAYRHWDEMSGWEKGLAGLQVLLTVVPAVKTARSIIKGAAAYNEGVGALIRAGLPAGEAKRLMLAAGVLQSEKAAMQVVDTLGDALRRGERLTAAQLSQLQGVFTKMLQRLPTAERMAIEASFATADLRSLREFVPGVELTEQHLAGLRRLSPEVLVALKLAGKDEPILVRRAATMAARSEEVAAGINALRWAVKPRHLAAIVSEAGEDILGSIGRAGGLPDDLAAFVLKARNATNAVERLMQGSERLNIAGLNKLLTAAETQPLTAELAAVRTQFARHYLSPDQLHAIARLSGQARAAFARANARELRALASTLGGSSGAVAGVENLTAQLGAETARRLMPGLVERLGTGVLDAAGAQGVTLSEDLLKQVAKQSSELKAAGILMTGFKIRRGARVPGLLDEIAGKLPNATTAERAIAKIELPSVQGELFARWALRSPGQVRAISPELADGIEAIARLRPAAARDQLSGLYRTFAGDQAVVYDFLKTIGQIDKAHGGAVNLDRIVAEIAAGGTKAMGASLTLSYAARRVRSLDGFEKIIEGYGVSRQYDMAADGLLYEFKYWRGFGGAPAAAAADEFARDVILNVRENFGRLRWVVAKDATGAVPGIESMMRGVLSRRDVRAALAAQRISVAEATSRLTAALKGNLIVFF